MALQVIFNDVWEVTEEKPSPLGLTDVTNITLTHTETGERRLLAFDTNAKTFRALPGGTLPAVGDTVFSLKTFSFEMPDGETHHVQQGQRGVVQTVVDNIIVVQFVGAQSSCWVDPLIEVVLPVPELRPREVKNLANWIARGCPR